MATPSWRVTLLQAVVARLCAIRIEQGYETDAGRRVYLGEQIDLSSDDPPTAIAVVVNDSRPAERGGFVAELLTVECQAIAKADLESPYLAAEWVLRDITAAMEQADRTLGSLLKGEMQVGPVRVVPREPGMTTVAVGISYHLPYTRQWGIP